MQRSLRDLFSTLTKIKRKSSGDSNAGVVAQVNRVEKEAMKLKRLVALRDEERKKI